MNLNPPVTVGTALVSELGLSETINPDTMRASDAARYVAKVLAEPSPETRFDEVVEHIGLTDPSVVAAFKTKFDQAAVAIAAEIAKVEAEVKAEAEKA